MNYVIFKVDTKIPNKIMNYHITTKEGVLKCVFLYHVLHKMLQTF